MRFFASIAAALVSVSLLDVVSAASIYASEQARDISLRSPTSLEKRFDNARFTFYNVGLGACGQINVNSDFVVALNAEQFGSGYPGPNCFRTINISYGGKSTRAKIVDRCPGCPYAGLDLSPSLFSFFAPPSAGVIYGTWNFA